MPPIAELEPVTPNDEAESAEKESTTPAKPTIGIIYPPPELRNIVDKTAAFVARNGPEFEARIRQNEINNPKFNFLNSGDPYHAYYQHKVKESKEGKGVPETLPAPALLGKSTLPSARSEIAKLAEPIIPKEPPPEFQFICDPPSISSFDLDIVKLTAQFVARNGRQFLTNLMNREQRNYQFDFLRPQHSLFGYFTTLLMQYTNILIPPKDLMDILKNESLSPKLVLEQVRYRVEWTKQQEAQRRKEEEEAERERIQYAQIDWHDFVVVETVDYQPGEHGLFPAPTTPEEVGTRVLQQQRIEEDGEEEMEVESEDSDSDDDRAKPTAEIPEDRVRRKAAPSPPPLPPKETVPQPPPLPPQPDQVLIRKDYNPKVLKNQLQSSDQFLISPVTGEKIPADKMQEHMRISLLDPRWVEQRDRSMHEKLQQEEVYAAGSSIESSLKQFAERRTDIFGFGDEEAAIGKKIGEEEKRRPEKVTWDGHTASMEAATRAARANITIEEQIQQIHKIKGLLPDEEKERIGPSKPQGGGLVSSVSTTSSGPIIITTVVNTTPISKPLPAPVPPPSVSTSSAGPPNPAPPVQRPPMPMPVPPPPGMMMQQPMMGPPPMHMMGPMGPQPHMQHPQFMAMQRPMGPPFGGPPMPQQMDGSMMGGGMGVPGDDEPLSKKQKTEESLIAEEEFLKKNKSPVMFKVQVPKLSEKAEWKLNGQTVTLTLPLTDSVSVLKAKIHEEVGMPPGKQKLQYEGFFVKDSNTLAYYNVVPNGMFVLQLKERGGRKR